MTSLPPSIERELRRLHHRDDSWIRTTLRWMTWTAVWAAAGSGGVFHLLRMTPDAPAGNAWWFLGHLLWTVAVVTLGVAELSRVRHGARSRTDPRMVKLLPLLRLSAWVHALVAWYARRRNRALDDVQFAEGGRALEGFASRVAEAVAVATSPTPGAASPRPPSVVDLAGLVRGLVCEQPWQAPGPLLVPAPVFAGYELMCHRPLAHGSAATCAGALRGWAGTFREEAWLAVSMCGAASWALLASVAGDWGAPATAWYLGLALGSAVTAVAAWTRFSGLPARRFEGLPQLMAEVREFNALVGHFDHDAIRVDDAHQSFRDQERQREVVLCERLLQWAIRLDDVSPESGPSLAGMSCWPAVRLARL